MFARSPYYAYCLLFFTFVTGSIVPCISAVPSASDILQKDLTVTFKDSAGVTVPMETGVFIIPVHVNDSANILYFVVDTGATGSAIDDKVAREMGIVSEDKENIRGGEVHGMGDKTFRIKLAQHIKLALPGIDVSGVVMALLPHEAMAAISQRLGRSCAGVVGYDVLGRLITEMDYTKGHIGFFSPQNFRPDLNATQLLLDSSLGIPQVSMSLVLEKQEISGIFLLDIGSYSGLKLYPAFLTSHPDFRVNSVGTGTDWGVGGASPFRIMRNTALKLGAYVVKNTDFEILDGSSTNLSGDIGNEIWSRFDVAIDGPDNRCYLEANRFFDCPFPIELFFGYLGLSVAQECTSPGNYCFVLSQVNPQGRAYKAGAKTGDVLTRINSESTSGLSIQDVMLDLDKKVDEIDVQRGGIELKLKVADEVHPKSGNLR